MGHFVTDEVDRVKLDKEHWVDIKKRMSYGDQQRLVGHYIKASGLAGKADINFDMASGAIELLVINIKAWSLLDAGGKPAPITQAWIEALDPVVAGKIASEINDRNPAPKA